MNNKVSIRLQGGLCNYMFQISCAYAYSLKYSKELLLTQDDSVVVHKHIGNYSDNILFNVKFTSRNDFNNFIVYNEPSFEYVGIPRIEGNLYLNGYFQSEKYFKNYEKKIRELFSFPDVYINSLKERYSDLISQNTCSIHVRRGDYLNSPNHHPTQSMNYYLKAVRQMPKDSVFLIFSDDIQWCKENFPDIPEKFKFIEGNADHEDLALQTLCNNNIICNSTFSWWGAWLNNNPSKIVIAPSKWFGSAYSHYNTKDLIPENWTLI